MKMVYKYSYRKSDVLRPHIFRVPKLLLTLADGESQRIRIHEMRNWCADHFTGKHPSHPRSKRWLYEPFRLRFAFAAEDDAFAFKMRWC